MVTMTEVDEQAIADAVERARQSNTWRSVRPKQDGAPYWAIDEGASNALLALHARCEALDEEVQGCHADYSTQASELMMRAKAATARVTVLEAALRLARETIDNLHAHGNWSNGNTDPTGSMDEGSVLTSRYVDRAMNEIDAALTPATEKQHG